MDSGSGPASAGSLSLTAGMLQEMLRPARDEDRDAVVALGIAEEEAWFGAAEISRGELGEWIDGEGGFERGMLDVDAAGSIRAFAMAGRHECLLLAAPASAAGGIAALVPWLRTQGPVQVTTLGHDELRVAALERQGLAHLYSSFTLSMAGGRPLPAIADWPQGLTVRPYSLGEDDPAVHRLIYELAAWNSVPGHTYRDLEDWRAVMRPGLRALLARRGAEPVGWVAARLLASGRGYIRSLAVARAERGRGRGRALLVAACADLLALGADGLALDVAGANESALGLYRSVGFRLEREWQTFADPAAGGGEA